MDTLFYAFICYLVINVLIYRYSLSKFYKLNEANIRTIKEDIYTSIVNTQCYNMEVFIDAGLIVIPDDYTGSKYQIIFDTIIKTIPEASEYVTYLDNDINEVLTDNVYNTKVQ